MQKSKKIKIYKLKELTDKYIGKKGRFNPLLNQYDWEKLL
jgi:hypothetical protein